MWAEIYFELITSYATVSIWIECDMIYQGCNFTERSTQTAKRVNESTYHWKRSFVLFWLK